MAYFQKKEIRKILGVFWHFGQWVLFQQNFFPSHWFAKLSENDLKSEKVYLSTYEISASVVSMHP
jgi:hypothetical protein